MNGLIRILPLAALWLLPIGTSWAAGLPAITLETTEDGGQAYSLSIQVLALMTAITLLPAILLSMTAFTRIIVVLALLRQALGTGATPSNQILLGLALFMTLFVMAPVGSEIYESAVQPYFDETMEGELALERAAGPIRTFMLANTRENHRQKLACPARIAPLRTVRACSRALVSLDQALAPDQAPEQAPVHMQRRE